MKQTCSAHHPLGAKRSGDSATVAIKMLKGMDKTLFVRIKNNLC